MDRMAKKDRSIVLDDKANSENVEKMKRGIPRDWKIAQTDKVILKSGKKLKARKWISDMHKYCLKYGYGNERDSLIEAYCNDGVAGVNNYINSILVTDA